MAEQQQASSQERQGLLSDFRTGFLSWRTRDILIIAAVSIVFGLVLIGASYAPVFTVALGPVFQWIWNGLWVIAPLFIAYVIRRPGAAFLTSVLCELVMLIFVPSGLLGLIRGVMYGICIEVGVAIFTRHRDFSRGRMMLAGAGSAVLIFAGTAVIAPLLLNYSFANFAPLVVVGILLVLVASCTVCSLIARLLADTVARTGALSSTALGRMNTTEV